MSLGETFKSVTGVLKTWQYDFFRKHLAWFGIGCALLQMVFFVILQYVVGYQEIFWLRAIAAIGLASFYFLPREGQAFKVKHKIYYEAVIAVSLPILFTASLLVNHANVYWVSSMVFCGLIYGLLSQQLIGLVVLIVSSSSLISFFRFGLNQEIPMLTDLSVVLCLTMYLLAASIRLMMQMSYQASLDLLLEKNRLEQIQQNFQKLRARDEVIKRYVRPSILTELALGLDPLSYLPKRIPTCIVFTDMRNYTTFTEDISDHQKFEILNQYFSTINEAVFKNLGEVDKIMGDSIMATFFDPSACLRSCVEMRQGLSARNRLRVNANQEPLKFGTGIAYGEVLSGNFGSMQKLDRTVVGDAVNVGSRLEQLTKVYAVDMIASEDFILNIPGYQYARVIDSLYVKG